MAHFSAALLLLGILFLISDSCFEHVSRAETKECTHEENSGIYVNLRRSESVMAELNIYSKQAILEARVCSYVFPLRVID
jgi:hypothetical protein